MTHLDPDDPSDEPFDSRVGDLLAALTPADHERHDPPSDLWSGIAGRVAAARPDVAAGAGDRPVVVSMSERRGRPRILFAAAAAGVLVVGGVGAFLALRDDPSSPIDAAPVEQLLASAKLEQLEPLGSTRASAKLVTVGGRKHLLIDATDMAPPPAGSDYELWLIDAGVTDPRSLGTVTGSGDILVPPSVDPTDHPIVDISLEPKDGDHHHSGHSLMRGTLG